MSKFWHIRQYGQKTISLKWSPNYAPFVEMFPFLVIWSKNNFFKEIALKMTYSAIWAKTYISRWSNKDYFLIFAEMWTKKLFSKWSKKSIFSRMLIYSDILAKIDFLQWSEINVLFLEMWLYMYVYGIKKRWCVVVGHESIKVEKHCTRLSDYLWEIYLKLCSLLSL